MAHCVYLSSCGSTATILFKGKMLCKEHAKQVRKKIEAIIDRKEKREKRVITSNEEISLHNPRLVRDNDGRVVKIRGTRLVIRKKDLERLGV